MVLNLDAMEATHDINWSRSTLPTLQGRRLIELAMISIFQSIEGCSGVIGRCSCRDWAHHTARISPIGIYRTTCGKACKALRGADAAFTCPSISYTEQSSSAITSPTCNRFPQRRSAAFYQTSQNRCRGLQLSQPRRHCLLSKLRRIFPTSSKLLVNILITTTQTSAACIG